MIKIEEVLPEERTFQLTLIEDELWQLRCLVDNIAGSSLTSTDTFREIDKALGIGDVPFKNRYELDTGGMIRISRIDDK